MGATIIRKNTLSGKINTGVQPYILPIADEETLGGVKVGENLSITDEGVLSAEEVEVLSNLDILSIINN